uniref:Uncharacterized protein n=1 Tax=Anguilla anguilla TaxID=7936 RepID=A0A0E9VQJ8_ANGAN
MNISIVAAEDPMKPNISRIVGTNITSRLLKTRIAAAMRICRIQLNS